MRIGIMLRVFDEKGGIGVYARNLIPELLGIDQQNEYFLFYNNRGHIGLYENHKNVKEIYIKGKNKAIWDQISIPLACRRENIDVVFHPKFTLPLFAPCKSVMTVHGADWFMPEQAIYYPRLDVAYIRTVMPLYFRKAAAVISVSQLTTENFIQALKLPPGKIRTIYFAPARHFKPVHAEDILTEVKHKYHLPEKFIFTLTKRQGDKRKNLPKILAAYQMYHETEPDPHKLVIGGKDCHLYRQEYNIPNDGYGQDIFFPGWIEQADLPAVYTMADLFLYPSNLEAFPIPITEAMACGAPIITSDANGLKEIAGDAALFVDPQNAQAISVAIKTIIADRDLRAALSQKGIERSALFTWDSCARKTLDLLREVSSS
jgi:glycosyltransferase involved in cell wall biosynthesis